MATQDEWAPAPSSAAAATASGAMRLEGYSGLTEVARGGDSIVYRAHQVRLDRDVAIKVIDITEPTAKARFARELEITVRLGRQHPHIISVLDTTTTPDGRPCLVMEFHDLGSLHDRLRAHGPLPVSEVVAAGTAVADALAFAHAHGVLHRDVKPQNVLLLPTSYVLSDFGIARMADAGHTASLERFSYRHASPQVLDGAEPTEADDVWSLGSSLFTLLDGRAPFASDDPDDDSALAYLRRVRMNQRRPLREDLPHELRSVIEACLTPRREDRTCTARGVLAALRTVPTEQRSWSPTADVTPDATPVAAGAEETPAAVIAGVVPSIALAADEVPAAASGADAPDRATPGPAAPGGAPPRSVTGGAIAGSALPPAPDEATGPPPAEMFDAWGDDGPAPSAGAGDDAARARPVEGRPPAAIAPSALAALGSTPARDADHTSARPEPEQPDEDVAGPAGDRGGGGNPWTKIAAFIGGALVVGTGFGVLSAFLGDDDEPDPAPTATGPAEVPTMAEPLPTQTGPIQASSGDPDLAPRNPAVLHNGTSVLLTWAPPVKEVDYIVVLDPGEIGSEARVLTQVSGTAEEFTVEGIDPDADEVCFAVAGYAVVDGVPAAGASRPVCATRP